MEKDKVKNSGVPTWLYFILVVVVIAGIGFFGWILWRNNTVETTTTNVATNQSFIVTGNSFN